MAIAQSQYVDLLVKQLYGVAKTDTSTIKSPSNESIASPALNRGDTQWTQSDQIPDIAAAVSGVVRAYTGANAIQCAPDTTTVPVGGVYPTWLTNLSNWIPQEFGSTYVVQVWVDSPGVANPTATGTQIFASGSGGTGEYYYDNIAGLLNFIGGTIPAALTSSKVIYIVGYRYIGLIGVTNLPSNLSIGNLNFTGSTITSTNLNGNIILTPNGSGTVQVSSDLTSNGNITATYFIGNGSQLTGISAGGSALTVSESDITGANVSNSVSNVSTLKFDKTTGFSVSDLGNGNAVISLGSTFKTWEVTGQPSLVAVGEDTVEFIAGNGIAITTSNTSVPKSITFTANNIANATYANTAGTAGTVTTNAQPNITSTGTLTELDVSGHLVANTFQMGYGIYAFYSTSVFFATTSSTATDQVLWNYPAADLSAIDFTIIATDNTGSTRQSCKISAAILGTTVAFSEYGGLFINGGVGSFSVTYNAGGPTPMLELVVTPDSSNLTEYNMLISKYLV